MGKSSFEKYIKPLSHYTKTDVAVELFWIPYAKPFLGSKSAKTAAIIATMGASPQVRKEITRRTTILSAAPKNFCG